MRQYNPETNKRFSAEKEVFTRFKIETSFKRKI